MPTAVDSIITVRDSLVAAIRRAGEYNRDAEVAPAAILWTDGASQWVDVVPRLRDALPILTLGEYEPEAHTGPSIWIRAELVKRIEAGETPVVYLPGHSKDVFRNLEEAPNTIEPLVYLQYRGAMFLQPNGKDWTIPAFLQNAQYGLGVAVDRGEATRRRLVSAATHLLGQRVEDLRDHAGGIDVGFLDSLLVGDVPRNILDWINDPEGTRAAFDDASWEAFAGQLTSKYKLDPERDGPGTAARKLGEAKVGSHWDHVWSRFVESPRRYPNIPQMLRGAKPAGHGQRGLFDDVETNYHWPQDNEAQEAALREALMVLDGSGESEARQRILQLETEHAPRRASVWAELGEAPLAFALEDLARVAARTSQPFPAGNVESMMTAYTDDGWEIDAAALDAVTRVTSATDRLAVDAALHAVYTPWLWTTANNFQQAVASGSMPMPVVEPLSVPGGTCVLFADGLRYDLAARLRMALERQGIEAGVSGKVGPLPGVTPSAKPAQSPVADQLEAGTGLDTKVAATGTKLAQPAFRKLLDGAGWQVIPRDATGKPDAEARSWTEFGNIDEYGHAHPADLPRQAGREIEKLVQRIAELVEAGWSRVEVVTDHGWLLTPRPMGKTDLPQHLTVERKGRCARLTEGAKTHLQCVPWSWDANVRIAMAPGISCFEDGKRYEHGGLSLQECVVPTVTVTGSRSGGGTASVTIADVTWRGLRCTVELEGAADGHQIDIRIHPGDASSSIVAAVRDVEDGGARVVVDDDMHEGNEATLVILDASGVPVAQRALTVGGE